MTTMFTNPRLTQEYTRMPRNQLRTSKDAQQQTTNLVRTNHGILKSGVRDECFENLKNFCHEFQIVQELQFAQQQLKTFATNSRLSKNCKKWLRLK